MSISLNNHESRIVALESGGSSTWTKGSNSNGFWVKEKTTGLIIQSGNYYIGDDWNQTRSIPLALNHSNTNYNVLMSPYSNNGAWTQGFFIKSKNVSSFSIYYGDAAGANRTGYFWLTIGYLISDRILKYVYAYKSLLFTPLRTIGGVK